MHLADAANAGEAIFHIEHAEVAQIRRVVAIIRRQQMHDQRDVRRALHRGDAELARHRRKPRLRLGDPVLNHLLREVGIGAEAEGDVEGQHTVGGRLAVHIQHVLDAVDLLFERRRD